MEFLELTQKGEYLPRMAKVPNSILIEGNIWLLEFMFYVVKPLIPGLPISSDSAEQTRPSDPNSCLDPVKAKSRAMLLKAAPI